jgi:hypothetical protein
MAYVDLDRPDATAWATLTNAERALAALVARGMTNRKLRNACSSRVTPSMRTCDTSSASSASTRASVSLT